MNSTWREALKAHLATREEIRFALLYGSAAESDSFRDVDVGVFVDRTAVSEAQELDYAFALAAELEKVVPYPVDVRVINDAPLPFRYNVSRGEPIAGLDEEALYTFLERTWDEFFDFWPVALNYLKDREAVKEEDSLSEQVQAWLELR